SRIDGTAPVHSNNLKARWVSGQGQSPIPAPTRTPPPPRGSRLDELAYRCRLSTSASRLDLWLRPQVEGLAFEFQQLNILILPAIERHAYLPWPCKHFRIFYRDFVVHMVGVQQRVA